MGSPEETKEALKEALKEWMDDKFATLGRWSLATLGAAVVAVTTYALLVLNGWHHPGG